MDLLYSKSHIREALDPKPSTPEEDMHWLAGASPEVVARMRASLPARRTPAAVLVPLVEHDSGLTVLLTQRATTLKDHARSVSPADASSRAMPMHGTQRCAKRTKRLVSSRAWWSLPDTCPTTS
jgi:hypothetical protein